MKTSSKVIIGVVAAIGISVTAIGGIAKHHFKHGFQEHHAEYFVERVSDKLELTEAQTQKLNHTKTLLLDKAKQIRATKKAQKEKLLAVFADTTMDRSAALTLVTEKTNTIATQAPEVIESIGDFYDSLDSTQQQTVKKLFADKMHHHD